VSGFAFLLKHKIPAMLKKTTCAFCKGTGKDPFDLLSPVSNCQVCNGSGAVETEDPQIKCVFCSGSGKNPLGARVPCIVCGGKGINPSRGSLKCPQCKGTGRSGDRLPCTSCGGVGFR
jgi:DnaJ-class molecular chaperone